MPDYFTLLGLPADFNLDMAALESAYFREQRLSHPDRFVGKPQAERQAAMQRSVDINNAYQTLKDSLARAQYLLSLQGIQVGTEADSVKPSAALLAEVMEWREQLEDANALAELQKQEHKVGQAIANTVQDIAMSHSRAAWEDMAQAVLKLSYLEKTRGEINVLALRLKKESA